MLGIRLYDTFNKAKDFFKKPIVHWSFGKWRNNHLLPIWRRGPILRLGKSPYALNTNCYEVKNSDIVIISRNYENTEGGRNKNLYEKSIIKRVIATEGQKVAIKNGYVYVDDKILKESYVNTKTLPIDFTTAQIVPQGKVFVLGDNRKSSKDSCSIDIGMVDKRYIVGKILLRFYTFE